MIKFTHNGATGDIIFSLPTIRKMGGGELYITKYHEQRALSIAKLIQLQPYISRVHVVDKAPPDCIDLNLFRLHAGHFKNLVEAHFKGQGIEPDNWQDGWLTLPDLPEPVHYFSNYSIVNSTPNYRDPNFDWGKEVEYLLTISDTCYFMGYREEYNEFQELFKTKAQFYDCSFTTAAYMIKYANMFTGCYSALSTIAQGLGIKYRLEQAPGHTCSSLLQERETIINGNNR